jgi:hypothetical protein
MIDPTSTEAVAQLETLEDFYDLMDASARLRRTVVEYYLLGMVRPEQIETLGSMLESLRSLPTGAGGSRIRVGPEDEETSLDLSYEISELEKDIYFLQRSEREFERYLATFTPNLRSELAQTEAAIGEFAPSALVSDRDGTVNNYCARYRSSVQSAYNAVFLTRFAQTITGLATILSSAPLWNDGLLRVSVSPRDAFVYAGSKGREFRAPRGREQHAPLHEDDERLLTELADRLDTLLQEPQYRAFRLVGSGFQRKCGELTVARQDIAGGVPETRAREFRERIQGLIDELDPAQKRLSVSDTGYDLEIGVRERGNADSTVYDKASGVAFIDENVPLELRRRRVLVCGDTYSDLPMLEAVAERSQDSLAIMVTRDAELREAARASHTRVHVVSEPDTLVLALNRAAHRL